MLGELLTQFSRHQFSAGLGQQISDQTLVARFVFARQYHRFAHAVTLHQSGLNLAELNSEAAQFDLKVIAAEIVEMAVGTPAAEVAGLVHTGVRIEGERIGKEALRGQFRTVQVATGDAGTGDMDFASDTERNKLTVGIKDICPQIG